MYPWETRLLFLFKAAVVYPRLRQVDLQVLAVMVAE